MIQMEQGNKADIIPVLLNDAKDGITKTHLSICRLIVICSTARVSLHVFRKSSDTILIRENIGQPKEDWE